MKAVDKIKRLIHKSDLSEFPVDAWTDPYYESWFHFHKATKEQIEKQKKMSKNFKTKPKFSFIVPLYNTPKEYLETMAKSVLAQTYTNLELILVNASPDLRELKEQCEALKKTDSNRITIVALDKNYGITENTNAGIQASTGDFCCFLDHDDFIEPDTLFEFVNELNKNPLIDFLYCDEDQVEFDNTKAKFRHLHPLFKPDFSPELLLCKNYIIHLMTVRKSIIEQMPHPDSSFDGSQDYNMALFCTSKSRSVHHIPKVLYHWRISEQSTATNPDSKPYSLISCRRAISNQILRDQIDASITSTDIYLLHNLWFSDTNRSIDVVTNNQELISQTNNGANVHFINSPEEGTGEYIVFANDSYFLTPEPLVQLVGLCSLDKVGIVGPKILYKNNIVKSFGISLNNNKAIPLYRGYDDSFPAYQCATRAFQNVSAVGKEGLCIKRTVLKELSAIHKPAIGDELAIEYCQGARKLGYRIVVTPTVKAQSFETCPIDRYNFLTNRNDYEYHIKCEQDPYLNPNLVQFSEYFQIPSRDND